MLKPLPTSKAKTAYGLISDVIRVVLEEPKRVNMLMYVSTELPEHGGPACGTVGCFAGWVALLAKGRELVDYGNADPIATGVLGEGLNYLTVAGGHHVFNSGDGDGICDLKIGTKRYANAVAKRIRRFQRINAKALKARKIPARA